AEFAPASLDAALPELTALLALSEADFLARFQGRAIMRAKRAGLARNACVALGNLGDRRAVPALIKALTGDASPLVRGHAAWALGRLGGTAARDALANATAVEAEPAVCEEIAAALTDSAPSPDGTAVAHDRRAWLAGPWRT